MQADVAEWREGAPSRRLSCSPWRGLVGQAGAGDSLLQCCTWTGVSRSNRIQRNHKGLEITTYLCGWNSNEQEGHGSPLQHSCQGDRMGRGAWQDADHGVPKSRTWLSSSKQQQQGTKRPQTSFCFCGAGSKSRVLHMIAAHSSPEGVGRPLSYSSCPTYRPTPVVPPFKDPRRASWGASKNTYFLFSHPCAAVQALADSRIWPLTVFCWLKRDQEPRTLTVVVSWRQG